MNTMDKVPVTFLLEGHRALGFPGPSQQPHEVGRPVRQMRNPRLVREVSLPLTGQVLGQAGIHPGSALGVCPAQHFQFSAVYHCSSPPDSGPAGPGSLQGW